MSGTDEVFGSGNQSGDKSQNQQQQGDLLSQLVGEGKKFKTPEDLARGKLEADQFIEKLKEELAGMRDEMASALEIAKRAASMNGTGNGQGAVTNPQTGDVDLDKKITEALNQRTAEERKQGNLKAAVDTLIGQVGSQDAAKEAIAKKAAELGVTPEYLKEQAYNSPQAFLTLMGIKQSVGAAPTTTKSGTVAVPKSNPGGIPGKSYFDALRKEDPRGFWSPKVQNELFKARQQLGQEFYNL